MLSLVDPPRPERPEKLTAVPAARLLIPRRAQLQFVVADPARHRRCPDGRPGASSVAAAGNSLPVASSQDEEEEAEEEAFGSD